jgi:outer membrane protein TolC
MKHPFSFFLPCLLFLFSALLLQAQQTRYDTLVPPNLQEVTSLEDFLILLAWQNAPQNRRYEYELNIADRNIKLARRDWSNEVRASFNLNEITADRLIYGQDDQPVFLPIYNFGASVSLGSFLNTPQKVKIAEEEKKISEAELHQQKSMIRLAVLTLYQQYLESRELLTARIEAEENAYSAFLLMEKLLKKGEAEMNAYATASSAYYAAKEAKIRTKGEGERLRLELSSLIGMPLDQAYRYYEELRSGN